MKTRIKVVVAAVLALAGHGAFAADAEADRKAAVDRALALIQSNPASFSVAKPVPAPARRSADSQGFASSAAPAAQGDEFKPRDVIVDKDGTEHVRFDRFHQGLHVIGGDVVVHSKQGQLATPSLTLRNAIQLRATLAKVDGRTVIQNAPDIGFDRAKRIASEEFGNGAMRSEAPHLVVFARDETPVLAYEVRVFGRPAANHGASVVYYVDASEGIVLDSQDINKRIAANGIGESLYYGDVQITTDQTGVNSYRMVDPTRGNGAVLDGRGLLSDDLGDAPDLVPFTSTNNRWGDNTTNDRKTVAADISYGVAKTWDYFKNVHGRNGIFNDGTGVKSYAHVIFYADEFRNTTGANAQWHPEGAMAYGDGQPGSSLPRPVVTIDVAGHEMAHGVTQHTARLEYSRDAGGLNESTSDIFGTLVKYYANNPVAPGNYVVGDKVIDGGLRKMYKQDLDGRSFVCYLNHEFKGATKKEREMHDPHLTSGVGNRFFYLLAEGSVVPSTDKKLDKSALVCNGDTNLAGIGRDKAGKIWYRTLTVYLNSNSTYPNARAASIQAAADLYGTNSVETAAVARAWSAVLVN
jgi:Zn-dependent metalloprotease